MGSLKGCVLSFELPRPANFQAQFFRRLEQF
jgi:hypothetical protein